ncbi:hypothetical protein HPB47_026876, partial [Ixodes persulcatus]
TTTPSAPTKQQDTHSRFQRVPPTPSLRAPGRTTCHVNRSLETSRRRLNKKSSSKLLHIYQGMLEDHERAIRDIRQPFP